MKKKVLLFASVLILMLSLSLGASALLTITPGYDIGDVTTSDIRAYIDGAYLNSYNINGMTAVVAEDLRSYGFDVTWDGDSRTLIINRNPFAVVSTKVTSNYGTPRAHLALRNVSRKTITAFKISFDCYDGFGNSGSNYSGDSPLYQGFIQNIWLTPCSGDVYTSNLYYFTNTAKIRNIRVTEVVFSDDTHWVR